MLMNGFRMTRLEKNAAGTAYASPVSTLHLMLAAKVGWLSLRSSSLRARAALSRRSSRCRSVLRPPGRGWGTGRAAGWQSGSNSCWRALLPRGGSQLQQTSAEQQPVLATGSQPSST